MRQKINKNSPQLHLPHKDNKIDQLSHNLTISEGKQWERSQYNAIFWTLCADKLHHQGTPPHPPKNNNNEKYMKTHC